MSKPLVKAICPKCDNEETMFNKFFGKWFCFNCWKWFE